MLDRLFRQTGTVFEFDTTKSQVLYFQTFKLMILFSVMISFLKFSDNSNWTRMNRTLSWRGVLLWAQPFSLCSLAFEPQVVQEHTSFSGGTTWMLRLTLAWLWWVLSASPLFLSPFIVVDWTGSIWFSYPWVWGFIYFCLVEAICDWLCTFLVMYNYIEELNSFWSSNVSVLILSYIQLYH